VKFLPSVIMGLLLLGATSPAAAQDPARRSPTCRAAGTVRMPLVPFVLLTSVGLLPANLATAFLGAETAQNVRLGPGLVMILLAIGVWIVWQLLRRERRRRLVPTGDSL
jgi:uncharacterized membrane protein YdjX (TVP38/TMEM64 family)